MGQDHSHPSVLWDQQKGGHLSIKPTDGFSRGHSITLILPDELELLVRFLTLTFRWQSGVLSTLCFLFQAQESFPQ